MAIKHRFALIIAFAASMGATLNAASATSFLLMGPSGGVGGKSEWAAEIPPTATLLMIVIWGRDTTEKVQFVYLLHPPSAPINSEGSLEYPKEPVAAQVNNYPTNFYAYHMKPGQYVVEAFGTLTHSVFPDGRDTIVRTIQFRMNTGDVTPLPKRTEEGQTYFHYQVPAGYHIGGLWGSASPDGNSHINSVGIIMQPGAPVPCCE